MIVESLTFFSLVNSFMKHSHVNIIPHHSTSHTDHTIPHKLFQIFLSEAPLLVSSCAPLQRIVLEENAGYVFEASNSSSFAEQIIEMHKNPEQVSLKCSNGLKAVENGYHWDTDGARLVQLYKDVLSEVKDLKLIASGGISTFDELPKLAELGCEGVIIGKAIYENKISLKQLEQFIINN